MTKTLHKTPASPSVQEDLTVYSRIADALDQLAGSEAGRKVWLHAPNPDLGGAAPRTLIRQGRADVVAELLADALTGQPG